MTEPEDNWASGLAGRGRLRASHADRDRVIELLKVAFVQGRLTQDELDARVGLALASRTYADLADLTADLPTGPAAAEPAAAEQAAERVGSPARTLAKAARRSGICILVAFAMVGVAALAQLGTPLAALALFSMFVALMAASGFLGHGMVDASRERRSRRQLPPRPRRDGSRLEDGRSGSTGRDRARPGARTDQTRADLRTHRPGRDRRHPSGRSARVAAQPVRKWGRPDLQPM